MDGLASVIISLCLLFFLAGAIAYYFYTDPVK